MKTHGAIAIPALALLVAGCAGTGQHPRVTDPVPVAAKDSEVTESKQRDNCIRETGSRIERAAGECLGLPGTVITREELERSGSIRTMDQLRRLPGM